MATSINVKIGDIDAALMKINAVLDDLNGEYGAGIFSSSHYIIEENFDGEYSEALSNSLLETKDGYLESMANLKAFKAVLIEYKHGLTSGIYGNLTSDRKGEIIYDSKIIYDAIVALDEVITDNQAVKKITENGDDFDAWIIGATEAYSSMDPKLDWNGDDYASLTEMKAYQIWTAKENRFEANVAVYNELEAELLQSFTFTSSVIEGLEEISGLLSGELSSFKEIWNAFEFDESDYKNYQIVHYNAHHSSSVDDNQKVVDDFKASYSDIEKLLDQFAGSINNDRYGSEVDNVDYLTSFLNDFGSLNGDQRDLLLLELSNNIHDKEKNILNDFLKGDTDLSDAWVEYGRLKGLQKLLSDVDNVLAKIPNTGSNSELTITIADGSVVIKIHNEHYTFYEKSIKMEIPPLTPGELDTQDIFEEYGSTNFTADAALALVGTVVAICSEGASVVVTRTITGVTTGIGLISAYSDFLSQRGEAQEDFVAKFGLTFDNRGNIEFSLYSLIMLEELSKQYNEGSNINDDVDALLDKTTSDKEILVALNNLAIWAENESGDINKKLGLTNDK